MKFLIVIALAVVSTAQEDGSTLRRRRNEDRKLFNLPPSFSCLTSIEGDINNNDLIACCPTPGPSDDVICTGLWCADPETLEITDANGCGCNDLKSSCDSLGMFMTNYLQAGDLCKSVDKCCDDDTTSEQFNSCMDKEEEDGLDLPDAFDRIPDGLELPLKTLPEPTDAPSQDTLLQQFEMISDMSLSLTPSSSPTTSSPTFYPTTPPTEEVWKSRRLTSSAVFNYKVNESEGTFSGELVLDDEVGWMAIGFSDNGRMVGSDAVGTEDGIVQKYYLRAKWGNAARVSRAQTLTDTSIEIVDGTTILKFTKVSRV